MATYLTPHFTAEELGALEAPEQYQGNLRRLAYLLEELRVIAGGPLVVSSAYRTPEHNAEIGGVADSRHLTGEAADFTPPQSPLAFWARLKAAQQAGTAPAWGELELDERPGKVHVHVTLARSGEKNGEVFAYLPDGSEQGIQAGSRAFLGGAGILLALLLAVKFAPAIRSALTRHG